VSAGRDGTARTAVAILLGFAAGIAVAYWFRPVFVAFASLSGGILLALLLGTPARFLTRCLGLRREVAAALVITASGVVLAAVLWAIGPPLVSQLGELAGRLPQAVERTRELLLQFEWGESILSVLPDTEEWSALAPQIVGGVSRVFSSAIEGAVGTLVALFIAVYLLVDPKLYVEGGLKLFPVDRRPRIREVLAAMGSALRWWLVGRFVSMLLVGGLTVAALLLMGIPLALGLGLLAGVLSLVPYIGPIVAALPAMLVAISQAPVLALYVAIAYTGIQVVENYLITPIVQRKLVRLAPVIVILSQVVLGLTFGLIGALLATPLTIVGIVLVQMLHVQDQLGDSVEVLGEQGVRPNGKSA